MSIDKVSFVSTSQNVSNVSGVNNVGKLNSVFLKPEERLNLLFEPQELGILSSFANIQDNILIED